MSSLTCLFPADSARTLWCAACREQVMRPRHRSVHRFQSPESSGGATCLSSLPT